MALPPVRRNQNTQSAIQDNGVHQEVQACAEPQPRSFASGSLANEFPAVFLFLCDPSIDATNWRAEQAIRPAVVTRKVCGGNRTRRGADTQQVLASVVRTARQRNLDPRSLITTMLCAPQPVVPEALALPPPA